MNILLVNKLYAPDVGGGAEVIAQTLAEAHQQNGHRVSVATTANVVRPERIVVGQVSVYRLPLRNWFWYSDSARYGALGRAAWHVRDAYNRAMGTALTDVVREVDPDVISFHNLSGFSATAWSVAAAARKPSLQVLHDYYHMCPKSHLFKRGKLCEKPCGSCSVFRWGRREQSNQLQAVVGVSQAILDEHVSHGLFERVARRKVIHNGVTLPTRLVDRATSSEAQGAQVFGFMGTISEWKGVQPMLEGFLEAHARAPGLRLRVAGSEQAAYLDELKRRYDWPGIEFVGRVVADEFLKTIDVLIVPSLWHEPLPTVILEARGAGVPVLGARRGGIPELVQPEVDGLLYEPTQPGALAQQLLRLASEAGLLQKLRAGVRSAARESTAARQQMVEAHERVYDELVGVRS